MGFFKRNDDPVAPAPDPEQAAARIAELDQKLWTVALIRPRGADTRARMDQLLDERLRVRRPRPRNACPSVPVIPGRSS